MAAADSLVFLQILIVLLNCQPPITLQNGEILFNSILKLIINY